jgi:hypothetical protein
MTTNKQYFEQQAEVARDYLAGRLSLTKAARRIAQIVQRSLADDEAWPAETQKPAPDRQLQGHLEWFGPVVPDASDADQARLANLSDHVIEELRRGLGLTSA